jgi:hypothetical protein
MSRTNILQFARQATQSAPVQVVTYTAEELADREAQRAWAVEYRRTVSKWSKDNAKLKLERERREAITAGLLAAKLRAAKARMLDEEPEIVTSVSECAEPFLLTRRVLRGKVAPKRRVPAIGNFFHQVSIFLCSSVD